MSADPPPQQHLRAALVLGAVPDWAPHCDALAVYAPLAADTAASIVAAAGSDNKRAALLWTRNNAHIDDLCSALAVEREGALLVIVPHSTPVKASATARAAALGLARSLRALARARSVSLVVDSPANASPLDRRVLREWAALFGASQLRSQKWAAANFRARLLASAHAPDTGARTLWSGDLRISSSSEDPAPPSVTVPGFRLVVPSGAGEQVQKSIAALLPISTKKVAHVLAQLLTVVPRGQSIGGLLNARNELELHLSDACDATTNFFCNGLRRSDETLLMRIESLTFLCRCRPATEAQPNAWVCDVAPVYQLSTAMTRSLDMAWYRKYVLGICGRSQIHMPPQSVVNLPILSRDCKATNCGGQGSIEPWIDKKSFGEAVAALTSVKVKQASEKKGVDDRVQASRKSVPRLRKPPTSDERSLIEREVLKRKEATRIDAARKRSRSGQLSLDSIVEPSTRPWTVRSSLSEELSLSAGACVTREQRVALRQSRQMRLQNMQSARTLAARNAKADGRGLLRRKSSELDRRANGGRAGRALVSRTPDASVLRQLQRLDKFFDYDKARARLDAHRSDNLTSSRGTPTHGVEFASDGVDTRDAVLVRYEREVARTKQEHDSMWIAARSREGITKLRAGADVLRAMQADALLLKNASSPVRGDTDTSAGASAPGEDIPGDELQIRLRKLVGERKRIDDEIRDIQARLLRT